MTQKTSETVSTEHKVAALVGVVILLVAIIGPLFAATPQRGVDRKAPADGVAVVRPLPEAAPGAGCHVTHFLQRGDTGWYELRLVRSSVGYADSIARFVP